MVEEKAQEKPFGLMKVKIIEDFFHAHSKYVIDLSDVITLRNEYNPICTIKLGEVMVFSEELLIYILKNPSGALVDLHEVLLKRVYDRIGEFKKTKTVAGVPTRSTKKWNLEKIHINFEYKDIRDLIPTYDNFSLGTKPYIDKLVIIPARFLDLRLFRQNKAEMILFECLLCGTDFSIPQMKGLKGKYRVPKFCLNRRCKAKGWGDFRIKEIETYTEVGHFRIGDLDFSKQIDKICYTFYNFDYFSEKASSVNLNDIIEVLGVIRNDISEVGTRKEDQIIREYIEVLDFRSIELKATDPAIIKELYDNFKNDRNYIDKIIDSIHPLSRGIYTFRLFKLINIMGIISSDSWDSFLPGRCQINTVSGSVPAMLKSSIINALRKILGINEVGRLSGQDNTPKSFVPTSQRGKEDDFQIRYGAFAYHNRKFLCIDEFQYMLKNSELLYKSIKYLEDGFIDKGSDGTVLHAECKLSIGCLMNYLVNKNFDEGYDYKRTLRENLNGIENSVIQRIDLHYFMPSLAVEIQDVLEKRIFEYSKSKNSKDGIIDANKIFNYIHEVKRIYPLQTITEEMDGKLRAYIRYLRAKRGNKTRNIREFRILVKLACAVSALRLKTEVDNTDLEYIQAHLVDLMIPFYEYKEIRRLKLNELNMNQLYRNTIKLLSEINTNIDILEVINIIRQEIESHYLPDPDWDSNQILDSYMGREMNTSNQEFRRLHDNKENIEWLRGFGYIRTKFKNKSHYTNKAWLKSKVFEEIEFCFNENKNKPIERKGVIQFLQVNEEIKYDADTFNLIIDSLIEDKQLVSLEFLENITFFLTLHLGKYKKKNLLTLS